METKANTITVQLVAKEKNYTRDANQLTWIMPLNCFLAVVGMKRTFLAVTLVGWVLFLCFAASKTLNELQVVENGGNENKLWQGNAERVKIHGAVMWKTIAMYSENVLIRFAFEFYWILFTLCTAIRVLLNELNWALSFDLFSFTLLVFASAKKVHTFTFSKSISFFIYALSLFYNCYSLLYAVRSCNRFFHTLACARLYMHRWSGVGMRFICVCNLYCTVFFNFLHPTNYILSCILAFYQMKIAPRNLEHTHTHPQPHRWLETVDFDRMKTPLQRQTQ